MLILKTKVFSLLQREIFTLIPTAAATVTTMLYAYRSLYPRKKTIVIACHMILDVIWYTNSIYNILISLFKLFSSPCQTLPTKSNLQAYLLMSPHWTKVSKKQKFYVTIISNIVASVYKGYPQINTFFVPME